MNLSRAIARPASALGAAALGLYALGISPRLEDVPAMLVDPSSTARETVQPDASLVATYAHTRLAVPRLVNTLDAVADLFGPG